MKKQIIFKKYFIVVVLPVLFFTACSKKDTTVLPPVNTDACAGKVIVITATPTAAEACHNDGIITISATGSTSFTFKVNKDSAYQVAGTFNNLAAGSYTVFAKDGAGCEKSVVVKVDGAGSPGSLFTSVKNLVAARCQSCHNSGNANGGKNFDVDCNIIVNKTRIKVRVVDEGTMPQTGPLPQAEKDIISNWINAGGGYTN